MRKIIQRSLYAWEVTEASKVFAGELQYDRVVIHENDPRPDLVDRVSRRLRGMPPLPEDRHNAITIGNHCFFPVALPETPPPPGVDRTRTLGWLMHELGHAWQFQHTGWRYFFRAIWVQMTRKEKVYALPNPAVLAQMRAEGRTLFHFNVEQQCDLLKLFYLAEDGEERRVYEMYAKDILK